MFWKSWSACDGAVPGGPRFRMYVYVAMKSEYCDPLKTCPVTLPLWAANTTAHPFHCPFCIAPPPFPSKYERLTVNNGMQKTNARMHSMPKEGARNATAGYELV